MRSPLILAISTGLLSCTVPAPPRVPATPAIQSPTWRDRPDAAAEARPVEIGFWERFGSTALPELIADGLRANASFEAARAQIDQARAQVRAARANLLPTVGTTIGLQQTKTNNVGAAEFAYSAGSASLDVAYDVDLFGGARAGMRAAKARYGAARLDAAAAGLVIETDIARNYVSYVALCDRLALTNQLLANARELLRIITVREKEGAASSLDEGLQSVEVQKLVAEHAQIEQSRRATLGAIAVLVGREAPSFTLAAEPLERLTLPAIDPGQPGDLMFRRPDVQAAEARIVAAHGDLQQARAAFLPGLHLSGSALGQALALAGPFGLTLTAAESITAPIFQAGRLRSRFDEATAAQVEMVALYRQSLLQALQEGDAALAAGTTTSARESALRDTAVQARHTVDLARRQYVDGDADLASLLDAQRNSIQIEDAVIQARQDRLTAAIDLYKALGGTPRP